MVGDPDDEMLSWDESVFRDEHVFEIDHVPETFQHRETQLEGLKYALRPAVRGSRPLNTVVRGPPGTGKTTAVQKVVQRAARPDRCPNRPRQLSGGFDPICRVFPAVRGDIRL
ncbi:MAG: hypothetical protein J07HR59_00392 [Halorubrum sp. J07HR59]|nr:MAG: hypothetical protein J07HR59_00392 [Halorubrum sp. J07HR59]